MRRKKHSQGIALGVRSMLNDLVLIVREHDDDPEQYVASFENGDPCIAHIPAVMLNLIGFMVGCRLLEQGHDPEKRIIVRLAGADYSLLDCTLGVAAARPLPNVEHPVFEATSVIYKRDHFHG
jgi:hypothetical protein